MTTLSLLPRNRPASIELRLPALGVNIVAFRDLTPIGVDTLIPTPVAPGARQFLEIVTATGAVVVADVRAVLCRPVPVMPDEWAFVVTWEFTGDEESDARIRGLLDTTALETATDVWH